MKYVLLLLTIAGFSALSAGTIRTEQANGTFETKESSDIVDDCVITMFKDGRRSESFRNGTIVNNYYANGKPSSSYNYNGGNEKLYVYDPETGQRTEPKYQY